MSRPTEAEWDALQAEAKRLSHLLGSHADGHRCTCTMIDPGVYHGDNMHPPEWEQDPWCPTHPYIPYIRSEFDRMATRIEAVRAALDIRTRAHEWMRHLGYEDEHIARAEAWRQPIEPWLQDDPPMAVQDLETACGFALLYHEAITAILDDPEVAS